MIDTKDINALIGDLGSIISLYGVSLQDIGFPHNWSNILIDLK